MDLGARGREAPAGGRRPPGPRLLPERVVGHVEPAQAGRAAGQRRGHAGELVVRQVERRQRAGAARRAALRRQRAAPGVRAPRQRPAAEGTVSEAETGDASRAPDLYSQRVAGAVADAGRGLLARSRLLRRRRRRRLAAARRRAARPRLLQARSLLRPRSRALSSSRPPCGTHGRVEGELSGPGGRGRGGGARLGRVRRGRQPGGAPGRDSLERVQTPTYKTDYRMTKIKFLFILYHRVIVIVRNFCTTFV